MEKWKMHRLNQLLSFSLVALLCAACNTTDGAFNDSHFTQSSPSPSSTPAPSPSASPNYETVSILDLGAQCDGVTDDSSVFNDASTSGKIIQIPDNATCMAKELTLQSDVTYTCTNCKIKLLPTGQGAKILDLSFVNNVRFQGVTFDGGGVAQGSYDDSAPFNLSSGGSGYPASTQFGVDFTGGSCSSAPWGVATTDASGVVISVNIVSAGKDCTSAPTADFSAAGSGSGATGTLPAPPNSSSNWNNVLNYVASVNGFYLENCKITSTGAVAGKVSSNVGALLLYKTSGKLTGLQIDNTVAGTQIEVDSGGIRDLLEIDDPVLDGSIGNAIQIKGGVNGSVLDGGTITNVTDGFLGTGENGNCVSVYSTSGVTVKNVHCIGARFSAVRVTAATDNLILNNIADGAGEVSYWAEFGAENNVFSGNQAINCLSGYSDTNIADRVMGAPNHYFQNTAQNCTDFGFHFEMADAWSNVAQDVPVGYSIGFGGTGKNIDLQGNTCANTNPTANRLGVCIMVDSSLTDSTNNAGIGTSGTQMSSSGGVAPIPLIANDLSNGGVGVSSISRANPGVITMDSAHTLNNGQVVLLNNIYGMTQLNGVLCTVAGASGAGTTSFNCGIDTTSFDAFAATPLGNPGPSASYIYSSGTTPTYTMASEYNDADTKLMPGNGSTLTSASSITITHVVHPLDGTTPITTIQSPPYTQANEVVSLMCSSACSFATGDNIGSSKTGTAGFAVRLVYDGSTWWPL
jgi:hypothetical protein